MPPPSQSPALALTLLAEPFFVLQTDKPSAALLAAFTAPEVPGQFLSITRTKEELSIVGSMSTGSVVPEGAEAKWKCFRVAGPMDFGMSSALDVYGEPMKVGLTGIMSALTAPLAKAAVPVFAVSTWSLASSIQAGPAR
jgi:hypothetical protein